MYNNFLLTFVFLFVTYHRSFQRELLSFQTVSLTGVKISSIMLLFCICFYPVSLMPEFLSVDKFCAVCYYDEYKNFTAIIHIFC